MDYFLGGSSGYKICLMLTLLADGSRPAWGTNTHVSIDSILALTTILTRVRSTLIDIYNGINISKLIDKQEMKIVLFSFVNPYIPCVQDM